MWLKAQLNDEHVCPTQISWSENMRGLKVSRWILYPERTRKGLRERVICQADAQAHLTPEQESSHQAITDQQNFDLLPEKDPMKKDQDTAPCRMSSHRKRSQVH